MTNATVWPLVLSGFLALALTASTGAAQDCSQPRFDQAFAQVREVQLHLLVDKVEEMDTTVPPSIQLQIRAMRDALVAAVDLYVGCQKDKSLGASKLEARLARSLGANEPQQPSNPISMEPENLDKSVDHIYGAGLRLAVERPNAALNLIGIRVEFGVMCGQDSVLLLYEWQGSKWRRVIRWQSGDYDEVSGAYGDFFKYVVIPRVTPKAWTLAVAHGTPWCTSNWSGFDLDVVEPATSASPQKLLFHKNAGYYRGDDVAPILKGYSDGVEIRLRDSSIDPDILIRSRIYRYRFVGDKVMRVQPVAMNGRDFVDEWLQTDWDEASAWTATVNLDDLKDQHSALRKLIYPEQPGSGPMLNFGPTRACSNDAKRFQVALDLDPGASIYFAIRQGNNSFTMLSASHQPDTHCSGTDLMRKQ